MNNPSILKVGGMQYKKHSFQINFPDALVKKKKSKVLFAFQLILYVHMELQV